MNKTLLAKALFDNFAETPDELSFRKGDIMMVLEKDTAGLEGWWLCSLHGRQGIVPGNRVKILEGVGSFSPSLSSRHVKDVGLSEFKPAAVYQVPPTLTSAGCVVPSLQPKEAAVSTKDHHILYQTPQFADKSIYQVPLGGARIFPTAPASNDSHDVYLIPPPGRRGSIESKSYPKKDTDISQSPVRLQDGEYNPPSVEIYDTPTQRKESKMAESQKELEVYDTPPTTRWHAASTTAKQQTLPENVYRVPKTLLSLQKKDGALEKEEAAESEVYDVPSSVLRGHVEFPTSEEIYDVPPSFATKLALGTAMQQTPLPQVPSQPLCALRKDLYDTPPAFMKSSNLESEHDVYSVPMNLKQESQNIYEAPEELLASETPPSQVPDTETDENDIYHMPSLVPEDIEFVSGGFNRLSVSSSGSTRSKSSTESCSGRESSLSQSMGKEIAVDAAYAMETLAQLHQSLQSSVARLMSLTGGTSQVLESSCLDEKDIQEAVVIFQSTVRDFCNFVHGAMSNSPQAPEPALHGSISQQLDILEEAYGSLSLQGQALHASVWNSQGGKSLRKGGQLDQLLRLCHQILEAIACVVSLIQSNPSLIFRRPRLPSTESLSRRPLPALPSQSSADQHSGESLPAGCARKGSIQDRPLPPPPVYASGESASVPNEYEGIQLLEEYDYVHLQGVEDLRDNQKATLEKELILEPQDSPPPKPPDMADAQRYQYKTEGVEGDWEQKSTPEAVHITNQPSQTKDEEASKCPSDLTAEDRQLLQFYAQQCQLHYATLIDATDCFFASIQENRPPKIFVSHGKYVIVTAHKLVFIGDSLSRLATSQVVRARVTNAGNCLCQALKAVVLATKGAALHYPSVPAIQEMVDRVTELSHQAYQFSSVLGQMTTL
ncbi:breast cancer anti-estrogen resistance protein 1-like isoform X2 [Protopterus annectens]|uniref:breast cancer anti-estrogen resistance protein 1-like isoform X2 n=1 Tax=Protopterus annectens TaxID=7888 RepID=UPI001CFA709D|nr:breast cancer anti-estrogen resistance protein 1-like isoform X2 [Protopterus annectens]